MKSGLEFENPVGIYLVIRQFAFAFLLSVFF